MKKITCDITCKITIIQEHDNADHLMTEADHAKQIMKMLGADMVQVTDLRYSIRDLHPQTNTEVVETP